MNNGMILKQPCLVRSKISRYTTIFLLLLASPLSLLSQCDCTPEQSESDSLQLIEFYTAMNGPNWTTMWDTSTPIDTWYGVKIEGEDEGLACVFCIDLDESTDNDLPAAINCGCSAFETAPNPGNNISGTWPSNFSLRCLQTLSLRGNAINDTIPDFTSFPNLCKLYLGNTKLKDVLSLDKFPTDYLRTLNLGNNQLTGSIPEDISMALSMLKELYLQQNELEGIIPDLSNLSKLQVEENKFTFEDLLPNFAANKEAMPNFFTYSPQDSFYVDTLLKLGRGLPYTIDLIIDDNVTTSTYEWYKDDGLTPFTTGTINNLLIDTIREESTGIYHCNVTNSIVNGLTLNSKHITIQTCESSILRIDTTICPGQAFNLPEDSALSFDRDSMIIFRGTAENDCDSAIIIILNYFNRSTTTLDTAICVGSSIEIGENIFSAAGDYPIMLVDQNGCDSLIDLKLKLVDSSNSPMADIGQDTVVCQSTILLTGNLPDDTYGHWSIDEGLLVVDATSENGIISQLNPGNNQIGWVLGRGGCQAYDSTFINVFFEAPLNAINDTFEIFDSWRDPLEIDDFDPLIVNDTGLDDVYDDMWQIQLINGESIIGELELTTEGELTYIRQPCSRGLFQFEYEISSNYCEADTATVSLYIIPRYREGADLPDVITPNGDGKNDVLIVPALFYDIGGFPNSHLSIFHQNGQLLFEVHDYQNDWGGTGFDGKALVEDVYLLKFDYGQGNPVFNSTLMIISEN